MNTIEIKKVLLKRGNTAQSEAYTGLLGEVTIDTDLNCLRIHDGETPGGDIVASTETTIQALIDQAVTALLNGAPEAFDTLKELADALGNNANSITNILTTLAAKANAADLATVATSGSYNDLTDTPAAFDPTGLATEDFVNEEISNTMNLLGPVATSNDYNDLYNKPSIPSVEGLATETYVDDAIAAIPATDLTGLATEAFVTGQGYITLGEVPAGFSGDYNDLSNKPSVPGLGNFTITDNSITSSNGANPITLSIFGSDNGFPLESLIDRQWSFNTNGSVTFPDSTIQTTAWTGTVSYDDLTDTPTLATVATSGSYNDLNDRPAIPPAMENVSELTNDANYVASDTAGITGADRVTNMVTLTQAEYDAIGTPDAATVYFIVG